MDISTVIVDMLLVLNIFVKVCGEITLVISGSEAVVK